MSAMSFKKEEEEEEYGTLIIGSSTTSNSTITSTVTEVICYVHVHIFDVGEMQVVISN